MQKFILPIILITIGVLLIIGGQKRSDSVEGVSDSVGKSVANAFDGKERQPMHVWYYAGGGALIIAGLVLAVKKK